MLAEEMPEQSTPIQQQQHQANVVDQQKPELIYVPNCKFGQFIRENCPIVEETFAPTWWASSCSLQTAISSMMRLRLNEMKYTRQLLDCFDGGLVSLDWYEGNQSTSEQQSDTQPKSSSTSPIALMFPGLMGDSQSEYLRYIVPAVHRLGYRVAVFNNRGFGGMELRTPLSYCSTHFEDVELAINDVRERNLNCKIVATAFSVGATILSRYLVERGEQAKLDAAMLISSNYDLVNGTKALESGFFNRMIVRMLTKQMVKYVFNERKVFEKLANPIDWDKLNSSTTFTEFTKYFTCPMWNYSEPLDYFTDATLTNLMPNIKIPTLALHSGDDLFAPYSTLPLNKVNEAIVFVVTSRGGHLGFMDGWRPTVPYYGDRLIEQYHKALLSLEGSPREQLTKLQST